MGYKPLHSYNEQSSIGASNPNNGTFQKQVTDINQATTAYYNEDDITTAVRETAEQICTEFDDKTPDASVVDYGEFSFNDINMDTEQQEAPTEKVSYG